MPTKAEQYEQRFPETGLPDAQKQERMERIEFKEERRTMRRTSRNRGIVIPELPWQREKVSADNGE